MSMSLAHFESQAVAGLDSLLENLENVIVSAEETLREMFEAAPDQVESTIPGEARLKNWDMTLASAERTGRMEIIYDLSPTEAAKEDQRRASQWIARCGVPPLNADNSFENFMPKNPSQRDALEAAKKYVGVGVGMMVFSGTTGVGKDHLTVSVLREMRRRGTVYCTESEMIREIHGTYKQGGGDTETVRDRYRKASVLAIAEVGLSRGSRDYEDLMYSILDYRYQNRLPTLLNSNLPARPRSADDAGHLTLQSMLGDRISSRIAGSVYAVCEVDGDDYRRSRVAREAYFGGEF